MATLAEYIEMPEIKPIFRGRYGGDGNSYFIMWANQLLEELQERGYLSAEIKEIGQKVHHGIWITPPSDVITLEKVYNPEDENQTFRVTEVNGKYKMMDIDLDPGNTSFETADTLTNSTVASIDVNLTAKTADNYERFLMYITAGTASGLGIILDGNNASGVSTTTLNYSLDLVSALSGTEAAAIELIPPQNYVVIKYHSSITPITTDSESFPIPADIGTRLVPTWLRWCCEREAMPTSKEVVYWENEKNMILSSIQARRSSRVNPAKGRRLVGMERFDSMRKQHPPYGTY